MLAETYQRYVYFPRPVSKRYPMDVQRRAKQFAPFAALRGLEETVRSLLCNLKNLKEITKNNSFVRKNLFYLFLFLVALHQIYSFISEIKYGISLL